MEGRFFGDENTPFVLYAPDNSVASVTSVANKHLMFLFSGLFPFFWQTVSEKGALNPPGGRAPRPEVIYGI
jgi:hypothetical protein